MVIGDVMVDAYLFGKVERISPEAPVPVVTVEKRVNRLGGAANVALNLKALGATPILCSVIGDDVKGNEFRQLMQEAQLGGEAVLSSKDRITTTKFRVIGNKMQMLRVDEEITEDLSAEDETALLAKVVSLIKGIKPDAIIFQDYNKGVLTAGLIREITARAKSAAIPVTVDPKKKNFLQYNGVSLFKPNLRELREGLGLEFRGTAIEGLSKSAAVLHRKYDIATVMVTLSDEGVFISQVQPDGTALHHLLKAHRRNISDVSGAGDTVISVATLCLACRLDPEGIAALSNLAGGLVCEEVGVVPVNRERLLKEALSLL
jgi:rfaE bifunctional protein kinase chain/domain